MEREDFIIQEGVLVEYLGAGNVVIPAEVTSIEGWAFEGCSGLTNVSIPNSVTSIGNSAFKDCIGLTDIKIPNGVTYIEEDDDVFRINGLSSA